MTLVRIAFDTALPVVASQAFMTGGRAFKDGDPVPWIELGLDERTLHMFWTSGLVHFMPAPAVAVAPRSQATKRSRK